jgi:hypothetical protein
MVAAATVAFAAAFVAPMYLRAAEDSVVRSSVEAAPVNVLGVQMGAGVASVGAPQITAAENLVVRSGGAHGWFGAPITSVVTGGVVSGPGNNAYHIALYSRTGICAHLVIMSGTCDLAPGQVEISDRSAKILGVSAGDTLEVSLRTGSQPTSFQVGGVYTVPDLQASYWWGDGSGIFDFGATQNHRITLDPLIASTSTALHVVGSVPPAVSGQVPVVASRIDLSTESRLERDLSQVTTEAASQYQVVVESGTPAVLAGAAHQRHVMSTIVVTVAVQLALVSLWVLVGLVVRSSEARQAEIRLARLRGFPWFSALAVLAAEPAALSVVALPLGAGVAWLTVALLRAQLFVAHTRIEADGWVWASGAIAMVAITVAVVVGAARVYRSTTLGAAVPSGKRRGPRWRTMSGVIGDAGVVILASTAVIELRSSGAFTGGKSDPLAAAGPGLIALGIAVVAVQLVLLIAQMLVYATAGASRMGVFLAVRQVARRPVLLRQARVLVVALCVACFATAAWSEAKTDRSQLAAFETGADQVVTVASGAGPDLEASVDRVDPTGRFAMAAVVIATSNTTLLGVDPRRLSAAAEWPPDISSVSLRRIAGFLTPPTAPSVTFRGSSLQVVASISGAATLPGTGRVDLEAWVYNLATQVTFIADLGEVRAGRAIYRSTLGQDCPSDCRFSGLSLVPSPSVSSALLSTGTTLLAVGQIGVGGPSGPIRPLMADLSGSEWTANGIGVKMLVQPGGPVLQIGSEALGALAGGVIPQDPPMAGPAYVPATLPAVVTTTQAAVNGIGQPGSSVPEEGLDGGPLTISPVLQAVTLPQVGADAAMTNLAFLVDSQTAATIPQAHYQVWLGPHAPRDIVGLLRRAGLPVLAVQRASTTDKQLDSSGPALADQFLLLAALAALAIAALSTLAALAATTRERAGEMAGLQAAGVDRMSTMGALVGETIALAVTALFGTLAGYISIVMVVPSLPILADVPAGAPPIQYELPLGVVALVTAIALGAIMIGGLIAGGAISRRADARLATMDIP